MSVGPFLPPTGALSISGPIDAHSATGLGKDMHYRPAGTAIPYEPVSCISAAWGVWSKLG